MEGARHFAVALGAGAFKLPTVADLVRAIANASSHAHHATARASTRRGSVPSSSSHGELPMAVLCGSRDAVDDVAAACSKLGVIRALHADQDADERKGVLVACARSTWRAGSDDDDAGDGDEDIDGEREPSDAVRCVCMVTTDACLPSAASGEASLGFPLLVNYDVPRTKEAYARRARVALGGGKGGAGRGGIVRAPGVVVTLVVADDETELLREVCGDSRVETMPVSALEEVAMNWFAYINNSGTR
jgi:superfamily II DNA/RNA helicase